jgi:hypothetical protein
MHYLEKFDDIALPSRDTDCVDNELLHPERIQQYMQYYAPYADGAADGMIASPQQLLNAFYKKHENAAFAGFKSMPNRHPNYPKFITRPDIRFITLVRRDVASTVASFLIAMETGSWRRFGGEQSGKWRFDVKTHGKAALGNLQYVMQSYAMLNRVPDAIKLDYEALCDPAFSNTALNQFFGREIKIDDPKPPTSGAQYVENWDEFGAYLSSAIKASGPKNET